MSTPNEPRVVAFCSPSHPEIFHAFEHRSDIWKPDPFDVESIHGEARSLYQRLVNLATAPSGSSTGRILLLQGEAGSGKTHLMRAFRYWTHHGSRGYCGYMQMTSATDHYGRYVLNNLINSLDQPYNSPADETSGLMRLSTAIAESPRDLAMDRLDAIRNGELDPPCLAKVVDALADQVVLDDRFNRVDIDLVRALLYLQTDDPRIRSRVLKYLRCEDLTERDREMLGGLVPRSYDDAPQRLVRRLGELMASLDGVPLVLLVDQLEDIWNHDEAPARFRRAMATLCELVSALPTAVVVIACLEDFYTLVREELTAPIRQRIEHDPEPIVLKASRERPEIVELIRQRLGYLFDQCETRLQEEEPTFPIPNALVEKLPGLYTRDVLSACQRYRERSIAHGSLAPYPDDVPSPPPPPPSLDIEQAWNDFRSKQSMPLLDDDEELASLLAWAIRACSDEVGTGHHFEAEAEGCFIPVECHGVDNSVDRLLIEVCNRSAKGGGLARQLDQLIERTRDDSKPITPVVVRSTEFPSDPRTMVVKQLGKFLTSGGRRAVVEDSDWRVMLAMREFRAQFERDPTFATWLSRSRPLSNLYSIQTILRLDALNKVVSRPHAATETSPTSPVNAPAGRSITALEEIGSEPTSGVGLEGASPNTGPIHLGVAADFRGGVVQLDPEELTRHAAFLGGTGSGKTTVALNIVEQMLLRGVPAVLVDRKGDLCGYAREAFRTAPVDDPALSERRQRLRERVDVAVFTPGGPHGRPMSIAIAPAGLGRMGSIERGQVARYAAAALGGMMNYRAAAADQAKQVILAKALETLAQLRPDQAITIGPLLDYIASRDSTLVNAIGYLEPRHIERLVSDLEVVRLGRGDLLSAAGEPLTAESLLGLEEHATPGKTRLSIVSTRFLGANPDVQFWVSQLLVELARWAGRAPSSALQALLMFDEADLYLPATSKPPTKEPMENLLKRARSAGLGLLLATQSPGDFDYKGRDNIRAWFLGKITQGTAIDKMRPMLSECRGDIAAKLPGQETGQFQFVRDGAAISLRAGRSALATEQLPEEEILRLARAGRDPRRAEGG